MVALSDEEVAVPLFPSKIKQPWKNTPENTHKFKYPIIPGQLTNADRQF